MGIHSCFQTHRQVRAGFVKSGTQGYDYSGLSASRAHTDSHGLPRATHSMNICDWTGQEEGEVDCLSDESGVIYAAQEVQQPLRLHPPQ